jgi:hypothetical protein
LGSIAGPAAQRCEGFSSSSEVGGDIPIIDAQTGKKQLTMKDLLDDAVIPAGYVLPDRIIPPMPPGSVLQCVYQELRTSGTAANALIPFDDSIPQITEGAEILTASITPLVDYSRLIVEACAFVGEESNTADALAMAIFRDATADALAATFSQQLAGGAEPFGGGVYFLPLSLSVQDDSVAVAPTTFSMRIGMNASATVRWNGNNGTRRFGGSLVSYIRIWEVS